MVKRLLAIALWAAVVSVAAAFAPFPPHALQPGRSPLRAAAKSQSVLLQTDMRLRQRKVDGASAGGAAAGAPAGGAAGAVAVTGADTDQLQSQLPYYAPQTPAHEITQAEREYTPEGQLDALSDDQRTAQAAALERFNQRVDTQVLVAQAKRLTARTAVVAKARAARDRFVGRDGNGNGNGVEPLTSASTANLERTQRSADAHDRDWLGSMRLASARSEQIAANAIRQTAREQQRLSARHGHRHRHKHALNLGQRVANHNRAAGRTAGRVSGRTAHSVRVGGGMREGDDGGDVEDEKYMATDEAKGQETEYEPDESSNNWWWDYWAPYIA